MKYKFHHVVVIGAGTMGGGIAALLANAGVRVTLLDIVPNKLTPEEEKQGLTLQDPVVRKIYDAARSVDIALVGIGQIAERTPGFCSLAEAYGVSVRRLRELGVVGEINYQPFDADGRLVDRPELRPLMRRVLAVGGERLQELSRRPDRTVIAVAGGPAKVEAVRGALRGRFFNVLVTDEDVAAAVLGR